MLTADDLDRADAAARADLERLICAYAGRTPPREVAVVGNAPLERNAQRARRIDGADLVIRCNSFHTDAVDGPAQVGRRVDVVVLNAGTRITPSVFDRYRDRLYLRVQAGAVYRRRSSQPLPRVDLWPDDAGVQSIPNRAVVRELIDLLRLRLSGAAARDPIVPTSGLVAAWLGHRLFPHAKLVLAGFSALTSAEQPATWMHHGGSGVTVPVSAAHAIAAESSLMREWVATGRAEHLR